jgi:hypothetical protein
MHGPRDDPRLDTLAGLANVDEHGVSSIELRRDCSRRQVLDLTSRRLHHLRCRQHLSSFDSCDRAVQASGGHP